MPENSSLFKIYQQHAGNPLPQRSERLSTNAEAKVMLLMMAAAIEVVGEDAAHEIWDTAAAWSVEHHREFRRAWLEARGVTGNHSPNAVKLAKNEILDKGSTR